MNKKILIVIIVILLLVAVVPLSYFLLKSNTESRIKADVNNAPKEVEVTNLGDSSFTVIWYTDNKTVGKVKMVEDSKVFFDDRDSPSTADTIKRNTHIVSIKSLSSLKDYPFILLSEDVEYKNGTVNYTTKTLSTKKTLSSPKPVYGSLKVDKGTASGVIVKIVSGKDKGDFLPLSTYSTDNGSYTFDLSNIIDSTGESVNFLPSDILNLEMKSEDKKVGLVKITVE
jgi:hypothetical protein